ncbi:putative sodium-dependent multivitamin transporter [Anabrus simplex]|uniref:putative sodium-dependent multivitamin transporter n=1 Tax=Anabrus simplex TaxID=316456 RepID=UPI0034DCD110
MDASPAVAPSTFGVWDYVILGIMLISSASIGIYYRFTGGRQRTTQEYLLGDRDMSIVPVAFSLMASFMSAITLMGVSRENYIFGTQFVVINFSYGLATPIAAYWFLPVFFRLQATSAYHYLELRFGQVARLVASLAFTIQMVLYMGIVLYAPALTMEAVMGINKEVAVLVVGLVCTFYSTIGGMKAVVITDVFQSLLMFAAVFLICIKGAIDAGGVSEVWRIANEHGRIEFDRFEADPTVRHTWWSLIIGGGFTYLSLYAVNQAQVQRLLTLRSLRKSQQALWISWPVLSVLSLTTSFSGLAIFSRYYNCDPVAAKRISSSDQLMPLFVVDSMSHLPGLSGLFVAGIFSGSLSTVSSAVNSLAAVTLEDYLKPLYRRVYRRDIPDSRSSTYTKFLAMLYGLLCLAVAFLAQFLGGMLQASLTIFGVIGGPLLGVFTLGMFCVCCNEVGAVVGLLAGLAMSSVIGFGYPKPPEKVLSVSTDGCHSNMTVFVTQDLWNVSTSTTTMEPPESTDEYMYLNRLSYLWCVVIGFLVTLAVGNLVSCLLNSVCTKSSVPPDPNLYSPLIRKFIKRRQARLLLQNGTPASSLISKNNMKNLSTSEPKLLSTSPL